MDNYKTPGYIWFDAEFSSLELEKSSLLQVAAIITDTDLKPKISETKELSLIIETDKNTVISPWVKENLSDLLNRCNSIEAISILKADEILFNWVKEIFGDTNENIHMRPILAGNSVHNDWFMARSYLPRFYSQLHYRLLDVSSFKIMWKDYLNYLPFNKEDIDLINKYYPGDKIDSVDSHDALFDIKASIAELIYYRNDMSVNKYLKSSNLR
tara:strand:+ start:87 stop:725 length:639 start_codon:yes stop_codon:yes gene_type:complete